jgi:hypothetical protein
MIDKIELIKDKKIKLCQGWRTPDYNLAFSLDKALVICEVEYEYLIRG